MPPHRKGCNPSFYELSSPQPVNISMQEKITTFFKRWASMMNPPVFIGAGGTVILFILFGGIWTETATRTFESVLQFITNRLGWYYVLIVSGFLVFTIWLFFSPHGKIRLGAPDTKPEFSRWAWFTMLFAAGMGMGLIFWGVAEPIKHYNAPPFGEGGTQEAITTAMRYSFFHWGMHPWAIYIIFGLGIAYFHYRHGLPLAPRSLLYPMLGERIHGVIGHAADVISTVGTLLGVATSLGLGAMQINSGLEELVEVGYGAESQILIIGIITLVATTSTITGVGKGIKYLSMTNIFLLFALLAFAFLAGPTQYQIELFITSLGSYLQHLIEMSLWIEPNTDNGWQSEWTLFYWGWWVSWCPFVGIFVARISKGRTLREFVGTLLILPPLVTFFWFAVFGGTALQVEHFGEGGLTSVIDENVAMSLNALLGHLPFPMISRWASLLLITIFFITSSDSGSLVDDIVTSGGHPDPPVAQRAFWGISEGAAAMVLVLTGGLSALQTAAISGGLLQSLLVIVSCISLVVALRRDTRAEGVPEQDAITVRED